MGVKIVFILFSTFYIETQTQSDSKFCVKSLFSGLDTNNKYVYEQCPIQDCVNFADGNHDHDFVENSQIFLVHSIYIQHDI